MGETVRRSTDIEPVATPPQRSGIRSIVVDDMDRQALWIASQRREYGPFLDQQIRDAGMTPGEWLHRLDRLAYDLDAEAHDPVTCRRIREAHAGTTKAPPPVPR